MIGWKEQGQRSRIVVKERGAVEREPVPLRRTALPVLGSSCCGRVSKSLSVEGVAFRR